MKLLTYQFADTVAVGRLNADERSVLPIRCVGLPYASMLALIEHATDREMKLLAEATNRGASIALDRVRVLPPLAPQMEQVVCIGCNYRAYADAQAKLRRLETAKRETPIVYFKRAEKPIGQNDEIPSYAHLSDSLDYAATLAFVLKKQAHKVQASDAESYLFGYTILNDITMRDYVVKYKQPYYAKGFDGFLPIGPWIATVDECPFPPALELRCRVNGELRQSDNTSNMLFGIGEILQTLTKAMTLRAGAVIATGTPFGTGFCSEPPRYLKAGDVLESEIEGVGVLTNYIV